jgi:RNA polymerase sigma factor (sigma-70 family)
METNPYRDEQEQFYTEANSALARRMRAAFRHREDAEDVAQDAWEVTIRNWGRASTKGAYLYVAGESRKKDRHRRNRRRAASEVSLDAPMSGDDGAETLESRLAGPESVESEVLMPLGWAEVRATLNPGDLEILDLRYRYDLSQRAVSERLGVAEGAVNTLGYQARRRAQEQAARLGYTSRGDVV